MRNLSITLRGIKFLFCFLPTTSLVAEKVCLKVNLMDTAHPKYLNTAREVEDMNKSFHVYADKPACFDLNKSYYMQYFMSEDDRVIIYATKCRYNPKPSHEGAVLFYKGISGSSLCPVENEVADLVQSSVDQKTQISSRRQLLRSTISRFGFPRTFHGKNNSHAR